MVEFNMHRTDDEPGMVEVILQLTSCVLRMIELVESLEQRLFLLPTQPGRGILRFKTTSDTEEKEDGPIHHYEASKTDMSNRPGKSSELALVENVGKLAGSTKSLLGVIGELPGSLKGLAGAVTAIKGAVTGVSRFSEAVNGDKDVTDVILGLAGGALAIIEIAAPLGPPGWIGGLLALGGLAIAADLTSDANGGGELAYARDFTPGVMRDVHMDAEREADRRKLISVSHARTAEQLYAVEKEVDTRRFVTEREQRIAAHMRSQSVLYGLIPLAWGDAVVPTVLPRKTAEPLSQLSDSARLALDIRKVTDVAAFNGMDEPVNKAKLAADIANVKKKFRPSPKLPSKPSWRVPTEREWDDYKRDEAGIPRSEYHGAAKQNSRSVASARGIVTINLRSLIENFTVHSSGTADTINSLRERIEEALLQILNNQ